ncbi:hypothetical protein ACTWQB_15655 [Piscibacillus sp. B03]|uniref:hypothetical protein n=1 Tax=Piscibacillus sp. B03 TaxID=3457430 RepID=UPI003FCD589D
MKETKTFINDSLLVNSIEAHKRIMNEDKNVDIRSIGYEEGTPIERVKQYNAFTILMKLDFPKNEVINNESSSRLYLDELAEQNLSNEGIIELLLDYRKKIV